MLSNLWYILNLVPPPSFPATQRKAPRSDWLKYDLTNGMQADE